MNEHLRFISREAGPDVQAGWHGAKDLQIPANITLYHLPPYSPELNPAERIWDYLRSHYRSNRVYRDYNHLLEAGTKAWNALDESRLRSIRQTLWLPHEIQA